MPYSIAFLCGGIGSVERCCATADLASLPQCVSGAGSAGSGMATGGDSTGNTGYGSAGGAVMSCGWSSVTQR